MEIIESNVNNITHMAISKTLEVDKLVIWNEILDLDFGINSKGNNTIDMDIAIYDPEIFSIKENLSQMYVFFLDKNNKVFYLPILDVINSVYNLDDKKHFEKIGNNQFLNFKISTPFKELFTFPENRLCFIYNNLIEIKPSINGFTDFNIIKSNPRSSKYYMLYQYSGTILGHFHI